MCVLSAGVGAGAATLVTSAQIKDGTIVGRDVKDAGLTGRDVKAGSLTGKHLKDGTVAGADLKDGSVAGADLKDGSVAGADLKDGSVDTTDLSTNVTAAMLDATIPSGTTVTGIMNADLTASVSGDFAATVVLPGRAHALLTPQMVNFGGDDLRLQDSTPECAGTTAAPTAPAGTVCLYLVGASSDSSAIRGTNVGGFATSDRAFSVFWQDAATTSDVFLTFTWAYTAP
jgi:hypothetical protein